MRFIITLLIIIISTFFLNSQSNVEDLLRFSKKTGEIVVNNPNAHLHSCPDESCKTPLIVKPMDLLPIVEDFHNPHYYKVIYKKLAFYIKRKFSLVVIGKVPKVPKVPKANIKKLTPPGQFPPSIGNEIRNVFGHRWNKENFIKQKKIKHFGQYKSH